MNSVWKNILFATTILAGTSFDTDAQTNIPKFQFGLNLGTFIYQGDLTPHRFGSYETLRPALSLFASKFLNSFLTVRGNLALGGLSGDDAVYDQPAYRKHRAFNFHSPVVELTGIVEWNLLNRNYISRGFSPYLFAGGGVSFVRVRRDYSNLDAEYFGTDSPIITGLNQDLQHSTPRALLVMPVGIGFRYYLSDKIGLTAESSYRIMTNDYVDGFSQAANPARGDHYYSHMVGVVYRIGKKNTLDCPAIKY